MTYAKGQSKIGGGGNLEKIEADNHWKYHGNESKEDDRILNLF